MRSITGSILSVSLGLLVSLTASGFDLTNSQELLNAEMFYRQKAEGAAPADPEARAMARDYGALQQAGAISDDRVVNPQVLSVYRSFSQVPHVVEAVATAYSQVGGDDLEQLRDTTLKLAYGLPVNHAIDQSRKKGDGYKLDGMDFVTQVRIESLLTDYTKRFYDQVKNNKGYLFPYNVKKGGGLASVKVAPYRTPEMAGHAEFLEEAKTSEELASNIKDKEKMKQVFASLSTFAHADLHEVQPGELVQAVSDEMVSHVVTAAVIDHAAKHPDTVFLLSFAGESKYQFFTVSLSSGYLNISFAATHKKPVAVLVASIPVAKMSVDRISKAIDRFMNKGRNSKPRHKVPDLLGIWEMRAVTPEKAAD